MMRIGRESGTAGHKDRMRSSKTILLCALSLSLSSCAWQSEALKVGDDTYQVSANASPARGGITGAREMALRNANKKCDSLGKSIDVTNVEAGTAFPANGVATVTFRCK
jgi:hypothetical protein